MSAFSQQVAAPSVKRRAPKTITLQPEHFSDTWDMRPHGAIEFGLRVPSEGAIQIATIEAEKRSAEAIDTERVGAFNRHLVMFVVARGLCSVHDVTQPHPVLELAEDVLPIALKSGTIERIYDDIAQLMVAESPAEQPATASDLRELGELLLSDDPFNGMAPTDVYECRKFCAFVLNKLRE